MTRGGRRLKRVEAGARRRSGPVESGAAGVKAVPITWAAVIHMMVWVWGSWGKPGSLVRACIAERSSQFERALQTLVVTCCAQTEANRLRDGCP